jgi:hypothetical protein
MFKQRINGLIYSTTGCASVPQAMMAYSRPFDSPFVRSTSTTSTSKATPTPTASSHSHTYSQAHTASYNPSRGAQTGRVHGSSYVHKSSTVISEDVYKHIRWVVQHPDMSVWNHWNAVKVVPGTATGTGTGTGTGNGAYVGRGTGRGGGGQWSQNQHQSAMQEEERKKKEKEKYLREKDKGQCIGGVTALREMLWDWVHTVLHDSEILYDLSWQPLPLTLPSSHTHPSSTSPTSTAQHSATDPYALGTGIAVAGATMGDYLAIIAEMSVKSKME